MAKNSLNCSTSVKQTAAYDSLIISLEKAQALLEVATLENFASCNPRTVHNYICALSEINREALTASEQMCCSVSTDGNSEG